MAKKPIKSNPESLLPLPINPYSRQHAFLKTQNRVKEIGLEATIDELEASFYDPSDYAAEPIRRMMANIAIAFPRPVIRKLAEDSVIELLSLPGLPK